MKWSASVAILLVLFAQSSYNSAHEHHSQYCESSSANQGVVLSLTISRSFHRGVIDLRVCEKEANAYLVLLDRFGDGTVVENEITELSPGQRKNMLSMVEAALRSNDKFGIRRTLDGSRWCLRNSGIV